MTGLKILSWRLSDDYPKESESYRRLCTPQPKPITKGENYPESTTHLSHKLG